MKGEILTIYEMVVDQGILQENSNQAVGIRHGEQFHDALLDLSFLFHLFPTLDAFNVSINPFPHLFLLH